MQEDNQPIQNDELMAGVSQGEEVEVSSGPPILSWQASEYIHHHKPATWYMAVLAAAVVLLVAGVLTRQWSGIAVLIVMTAAVLVYASKQPRVLNYSLSEDGLMIDSKFHPYSQFKSFGVVTDVGWHSIDLDPMKRFMPRLTILLEDHHIDDVIEALSMQLPRNDRGPDAIERLSRRLRF
jgi:hypothetical protein